MPVQAKKKGLDALTEDSPDPGGAREFNREEVTERTDSTIGETKKIDSAGGYAYTSLPNSEVNDVPGQNMNTRASLVPNAEYLQIVAKANCVVDIAADVWGALFFVVVCDFPAVKSRTLSAVGQSRLLFSFGVFVINLFIQGILLYFICKLLMMPGMLSAQNVYKYFTEKAFAGGLVDTILFEDMSAKEKHEVCGLALSQALFARVILFLWVTTNVGEIKNNYNILKDIVRLPDLPVGLDMSLMIHDNKETKHHEISVVCLNRGSKMLLTTFIFIPKFIIVVFLTLMGSLWLMAAENIGDLILNSLALAFVVQVDELIAEVFFPHFYIEDLHNLELCCQEEDIDPEIEARTQVRAFGYSTILILLTVLSVELAIRFQPVIPNYNGGQVSDACLAYVNDQVPWCMPGQLDCFPES